MKLRYYLGMLAVGLGLGGQSTRAEPPLFSSRAWCFPSLCDAWQQRKGWCPDDYCPKKLPPIPEKAKGWLPDDYHPKKLPALPGRAPCGCADDYCAKDCPIRLRLDFGPWYTCGPAGNCGHGNCGCPKPKP